MISTIAVHQPPSLPPQASATFCPAQDHGLTTSGISRRLLSNLQFLDLTDCISLEDAGVKMVVETSPHLLYLFMRRCNGITGEEGNRILHFFFFFIVLGNREVSVGLFSSP